MQLVDADISATGTNVSGSRSTASSRLRSRRRRAGWRRPHPLRVEAPERTEVAQTAGRARDLSTLLRRIYNQEVPETCCSTSAPMGRTRPCRSRRPPRTVRHRKGDQARMARVQVRHEDRKYFIPGKPKEDLELPFLHCLEDDDGPLRKVACTLTTSAGDGHPAGPRSPPIDKTPRRRRRRRPKKKPGRRGRRGASARPAAPALPPPFADLVQLRVGRGALPSGAGSSGPHIATASSALRSGRSQAASASALGRIAGIRSWTGATTSFGVVVTIVQL